ncbi:MAG: hypothetical protein ABI833_19640 [Acidobacteriota bacterium]
MAEDNNKSVAGSAKERSTDWMEILKVVAMPLVVTVVGLIINTSLSERQSKDADLRLYSDMMARREQADSELRKDMFTNILNKFTEEKTEPKSVEHLEQQVVNLELMAYNFNESIDLGPLFQHLRRQIPGNQPGTPPAQSQRFADLRKRLERVATEVDERQLSMFGDGGVVIRTNAENLAEIHKAPAKITFLGTSAVATKGAKPDDDVNQVCLGLYAADDKDSHEHYRRFQLEVIDFDSSTREIQVRLYVSELLTDSECHSVDLNMSQNVELDIYFWVGLFDFPMIDNTRLTHNERCSISLTSLSPDAAELALAYFPSSRASLKDKPYFDEVEHDLLHKESKRPNKK